MEGLGIISRYSAEVRTRPKKSVFRIVRSVEEVVDVIAVESMTFMPTLNRGAWCDAYDSSSDWTVIHD